MNGKIGARVSRVFGDGGSQGREIGKFFFVPQLVQEFDSHEFTVSIDGLVEQVASSSTRPWSSTVGRTPRLATAGRAVAQAVDLTT